jgi:hypothetical protein
MPGSSRATGMTRTPERFAFVVLMLCLVATWAGVIPFEMRQVFIAYLIFCAAWSVWILLEWWRATRSEPMPQATTLEPKGIDLDRDCEARRRFVEVGTP